MNELQLLPNYNDNPYVTSRKVAGSIPNAIAFCSSPRASGSTVAFWGDAASHRNEYQGARPAHKADDHTGFLCYEFLMSISLSRLYQNLEKEKKKKKKRMYI
jgi:hypothetical protein